MNKRAQERKKRKKEEHKKDRARFKKERESRSSDPVNFVRDFRDLLGEHSLAIVTAAGRGDDAATIAKNYSLDPARVQQFIERLMLLPPETIKRLVGALDTNDSVVAGQAQTLMHHALGQLGGRRRLNVADIFRAVKNGRE